MYPKDTEKWKQFTTGSGVINFYKCCFVSQRYWKMKAIHNGLNDVYSLYFVVLYPKDTEKWKQFTTNVMFITNNQKLFCIPKILKNESNSQQGQGTIYQSTVVLYPKDTEKWKQFTTKAGYSSISNGLFCIPKILKNESNSQLQDNAFSCDGCCFVSQRYWKMKAIHNNHI